MADEAQKGLFAEEEITPWKAEWQNMPEFSHDDLAPRFQIIINFACAEDVRAFAELIGQKINPGKGRQLQSFWFPEQEIGRMMNKRYVEVMP